MAIESRPQEDSKVTNTYLFREAIAVAVALILCLLILWFPMGLRRSKLNVPISYYGGDDLAYSVFMKGVVDGGWFLHNEMLGAPFGTDLHDFPVNDSVSLILVKFLSLFTHNYPLIFNLFLLINYPLTVLITYAVFRHFKLGYATSITGSLFYAFLPYHYSRAIGHIFYSVYFAVPLIVMVIIWLLNDTLQFREMLTLNGIRRNKGKLAVCLATCILIGSTGGFYYSFFALFFLAIAGLLLLIRDRKWQALIAPLVVCSAILLVLTINVAPNLAYYVKHGRTAAVVRTPAEAEYGGLKISSLLLPLPHHIIPSFAALRATSLKGPLNTENQDSTLGVFGSIGFLFLLGLMLFGSSSASREDAAHNTLRQLGTLNIAGVLFGTIAGFGSLFALLIWPQIRGYNRISVFIAFFSFLAFFTIFERGADRMARAMGVTILPLILMAIVFVVGTADLLGKFNLVNDGEFADAYRSDRDFVAGIENRLPEGAMVFQLPYAAFPESRGQVRMQDYDHLRGYFNSSQLRWSFGAMKGRMSDLWQQSVSSRAVPDLVDTLTKAGFSGIYLDRFGYEDDGRRIEEELSRILGAASLISKNKRQLFFDLTEYQRQLQARFTAPEWEREKNRALHPPLLMWGDGFYGLETLKDENWRWGRSLSYARILNSSDQVQELVFEASFTSLASGEVEIHSSLFQDRISVSSKPSSYSRTVVVPPGEHVLEFRSNITPPSVPNDDRSLVFRINNARLRTKEEAVTSIPTQGLPEVVWVTGFYPEENLGSDRWRWSQNDAEAIVKNASGKPGQYIVEMSFASLNPGKLQIKSAGWNDSLSLTDKAILYTKEITVGPGEMKIVFHCDAASKVVPNDDRKLGFRINNFRIRQAQ